MFHHIEYRVMFIFRRKLQVFSLGVTIQCDLKWHKHLQFITFETTETDTRFEQHQDSLRESAYLTFSGT